jgi:uncharacterized membrane protein
MAVLSATRQMIRHAGAPPGQRDARWEQLIMRIGFIGTGVLMLNMAFRSWQIGQVGSRHVVVSLVFAEYAVAFALLLIGVASIERMRRLVPLIAVATLFAFVVWSFIQIHIAFTIYGTDNAALSHVAAEKLMDGQNPYSFNDRTLVEESAQRFGVPQTFITDTTDGQPISNLMSWPAGSVLVLVPSLALGVDDVRWVVVIAEIITFAILWFRAPPVLRPLALLPLTVDPDLFIQFTGGGVMDYLWVAPMTACAAALYSRRLSMAGLMFGLAAGIKQQPWLLAPFLLIWLWQTQDRERRLSAIAEFAGVAAVGFLALNLPFMLWDFGAWTRGVMLPLSQPLVPFGSGISLLTQAGIADLPKRFYSAATIGVLGVLVIAYALHFRTFKHALWFAPAIIMWFGYRGLQNYFVFWAPVALIALYVWWEEQEHSDALEEVEP